MKKRPPHGTLALLPQEGDFLLVCTSIQTSATWLCVTRLASRLRCLGSHPSSGSLGGDGPSATAGGRGGNVLMPPKTATSPHPLPCGFAHTVC